MDDFAGRKRVALVAHDNKKLDLLEWARFNRGTLAQHEFYATGTTDALLANELNLKVVWLESGPLGGDQQMGAMSLAETSTSWCSSGIRWSRSLTIPTSKLCYE